MALNKAYKNQPSSKCSKAGNVRSQRWRDGTQRKHLGFGIWLLFEIVLLCTPEVTPRIAFLITRLIAQAEIIASSPRKYHTNKPGTW